MTEPTARAAASRQPTALITGASRGVGAQIARALAPTHRLILGGRPSAGLAELAAELGVAATLPVDLTEHRAVAAAVAPITALDVLVHSAGVAGTLDPVADTPAAQWRSLLEINVIAAAELTRLLLPALRARRGHVVFLNSGAGQHVRAGWTPYAASKFALRALADGLRAEEPRLRVTSIYPGRIDTDMQREIVAREGGVYDRARPDAGSLARLRRAVDEGGSTVAKRFRPARLLPGLTRGDGPLGVHRDARYRHWAGSDAEFRRALVDLFNGNRTTALIGEYLDNDLRILTATGVISVAGDRVTIGSPYARFFFAAVDDRLEVTAPAVLTAARRAEPPTVVFGPDATARADALITAEHDVPADGIDAFIRERERERFDAAVSAAFPAHRVHEHLALIAADHRSAAVNTLRDKAFGGKPTVPCMYEYLIGLSLYYAAGRTFDLRRAFGLSLDGDFLPISHAPGLRGDLEFGLGDRRVLVEVTLMDPATQRRGELEPVLRHATNLACAHPETPVLTLFIANAVDRNVARIFGFARLMALTPTDGGSGTARPLIVPLTTRDWLAVSAAPLPALLDLIAAEADRTDPDHLNSEWDDALVSRLRTLASS